MKNGQQYDQLISQNEELKAQLTEAHDIIDAIRKGEVDAFIVKNNDAHELYTLKSADRSYRVFMEQMSEGAITINQNNIILYANPGFARLAKTDIGQVIGFNLEVFMPALQLEPALSIIKEAWQKGQGKGEILLEIKNEASIPVLLSINKLLVEENEALSIIVTDLSLQKESLHQKKALETKDEFISIASHELKTPVTSIKGYVQLLKYNFENDGNQPAADMLGKVDTQINKLTNLIGDLLDVKKIENGQLLYQREEFDFNELVKEVVEETQRVIPNHPITCIMDTPKNVMGDRIKIGQVLTNFIDNAAKYSPAGSPIIITTKNTNDYIQLSVKDNGIGIPADQQAKVFDRFFRVNGDKENTYAGLGLGLYISAEIIKRHKGKLYLESEPDKGSVFYFQLPYIH
ncbi:MAG: HAMP domain-containing histidine kinase [Chitinophagaceae bacterium]|nr:MAG: HAMP domain-containing histidine kinase [Chitinophagaceae bacterium]